MFLDVMDTKYLHNYKIQLSFSDSTNGEINLSSALNERIFAQLEDITFCKNFTLEEYPLSWQNGADFAPEFLQSQTKPNQILKIINI